MALDYSKLTDDELEAIANDDYSRLSNRTLRAISNDPSAKQTTAVSAEPTVDEIAMGATSPAITGAAYAAPMNVNAGAVKQALSPMAGAIPKTLGVYTSNPLAAVADLGAVSMGLPPPVASVQGGKSLFELPGAISETASKISQTTSQGMPGPGGRPMSIDPYQGLRDSLRQAGAADIYDDVMRAGYAKGGNNAVLSGLQSNPKFQQLLVSNPEVAAAFEAYGGAVPSKMAQVGRVLGPVARGAARVAGPAGMAYNLYEAGQVADQTQLGQRLAQGQGQSAEQAFRGGLGMSYQGPQLSPQEAQNVLSSGSQRDIQYFGGQDKLSEMIRKKAAEKVLGPVAPGSF